MTGLSAAPRYSLRRDYLLWILLAALLVLSASAPEKITHYPRLIGWPTIQTLLGLLLLTQGIEMSGSLARLSARFVPHLHDARTLALYLMALAALLAMLLTNDVALFIVVPLTLQLGSRMRLPLGRLVIFEALAVNTGSLLTPIGNPQNIFLWQHAGMGFGVFVWHMLPVFLISAATLAVFTLAAFENRPLLADGLQAPADLDRRLLWLSGVSYIPFLIMADLQHTGVALAVLAVLFLAAAPRILYRIDWPLIVVFVLMFLDMRLLAEQVWVSRALAALDLHRPGILFATAALLSQGISNVPATILLAQFSGNWAALAWGANIGGFGVVTGSLASLIALRIGRQRGALVAFHAWSVPFLLITGALTGLWLLLAAG